MSASFLLNSRQLFVITVLSFAVSLPLQANHRSERGPLQCKDLKLGKAEDSKQCKNLVKTPQSNINPFTFAPNASSVNPMTFSPGQTTRAPQSVIGTEEEAKADKAEKALEAAENEWDTYGKSNYVSRLVTYTLDRIEGNRHKTMRCCLHFLKQSLLDSCFMSEKPNIKYASDFGPALEKAGFKNILHDVEKQGCLCKAPRGAILVYKATNTKTGHPGHIEIKDDNGTSTYSSFYTSNAGVPRTGSEMAYDGKFKGRSRELIGIYIKPDGIPGVTFDDD